MQEIVVGLASCGIAAGGLTVYDRFAELLDPEKDDITLEQTGCIGMCFREPLVEIIEDDGSRILYGEVTPERADRIMEEHLRGGKVIKEWVVKEDEFLAKQKRIALRNCGEIDPFSLEAYRARDGYRALEKVTEMTPEQVIDTIAESGIRGRGGAGFPTGTKWRFAHTSKDEHKYFICNADEGDPGAFMDRSLLEGDPHAVIEGMEIAAYAVGATHGYVYVRAEYPLAIKRLTGAIDQARRVGLLGANVLETDFSFDIELRIGAGAFVCGEETALIASIEGKRGVPRTRPPYPAVSGVFGRPTLINNAETWGNIRHIVLNGPEWFSSVGTEKSPGTKVFALSGKVNNTGLVEVPMGTTLRELIFDIGGGIPDGKEFKAVQTGGPSGGCIPAEYLDTPIDYESLKELGTIMGSGGVIVMDEDNCMVNIAKFFLEFTCDESCGQCVPCRAGTRQMLDILGRITDGEGRPDDIERLRTLGETIIDTSLCGLGRSAPNPVLSTLRHFGDEYRAHIEEGTCPAKVCTALIRFEIDAETCRACDKCRKVCPAGAISGTPGTPPYRIDAEVCIRCGRCAEACPFGAIRVESGPAKRDT